ncbi:hypothetical protein J4Q44_G00154150 [Coregonus suidteri]|uniref:Uncharacterized protein n=1 Tax=Coregonus suidteri TaxID=861788 RepID=A0AAN8QWC7_9TELE
MCGVTNRTVDLFPHLLPYHGPEEHDLLGEEFLNYQTMPMISLQDETEMESFWAEMATRKHKTAAAMHTNAERKFINLRKRLDIS